MKAVVAPAPKMEETAAQNPLFPWHNFARTFRHATGKRSSGRRIKIPKTVLLIALLVQKNLRASVSLWRKGTVKIDAFALGKNPGRLAKCANAVNLYCLPKPG
jgi:hypothetical protein